MAIRDSRGRIIIGGAIDPNWVTPTAVPEVIASDTTSITVTYTEGDVSVSTGYDITVTEE